MEISCRERFYVFIAGLFERLEEPSDFEERYIKDKKPICPEYNGSRGSPREINNTGLNGRLFYFRSRRREPRGE